MHRTFGVELTEPHAIRPAEQSNLSYREATYRSIFRARAAVCNKRYYCWRIFTQIQAAFCCWTNRTRISKYCGSVKSTHSFLIRLGVPVLRSWRPAIPKFYLNEAADKFVVAFVGGPHRIDDRGSHV